MIAPRSHGVGRSIRLRIRVGRPPQSTSAARKAEGIEMLAVVAEAEDAVAAARCQKQAECKLHQDEDAFRHVCDAFVQLRHIPRSLRSF